MAQPELITAPPLRVVAPKPKMTIYYALLIISLLAMLTACLFLYLEIRRFGGFGTVQGRVSMIEQSESLVCHREHRIRRVDDSGFDSASSVATSRLANC